ncbi:MAG: hypothetical protein HY884_09170 [Deltaproteobacteria bacterium]|nr:hypothetical protein [Deltaproteobacteria bacterium]
MGTGGREAGRYLSIVIPCPGRERGEDVVRVFGEELGAFRGYPFLVVVFFFCVLGLLLVMPLCDFFYLLEEVI